MAKHTLYWGHQFCLENQRHVVLPGTPEHPGTSRTFPARNTPQENPEHRPKKTGTPPEIPRKAQNI